MSEQWVKIATYSYIHEAELARSNLETADIFVQLQNAQTLAVHTFLSETGEGIRLLVPESQVDEAVKILATDFSDTLQ